MANGKQFVEWKENIMTFEAEYQRLYDSFIAKHKLSPDERSVWSSAEDKEFQAAYQQLLTKYGRIPLEDKLKSMTDQPKETMVDKALRSELKQKIKEHGVPSQLEVARALSRLEILPNPNVVDIDNPEKYVESPWQIVPVPTIDPNLWDNAVLDLVDLNDLFGTDPYLSRKKVRKHIEVLGQSLMPNRHYSLVAVVNNQQTIIDGHHRLMAQWLLGQATSPAWVIKLKVEK